MRIPLITKKFTKLEKEIVIGNLRFIGFLGEGSFACTFLALDSSGRLCVVKVPKEMCVSIIVRGVIEETIRVSREFIKELEVLKRISKINHPHIVEVYEVPKEAPLLVFEYCEGGSLADVISSGHRIGFKDVILLGVQIADALLATYNTWTYRS